MSQKPQLYRRPKARPRTRTPKERPNMIPTPARITTQRPVTIANLGNGLWRARLPLDNLEVTAGSRTDALNELKAIVTMQEYAAWRLRQIKKATKIAYAPDLGCYVAECPAADTTARGFTRAEAWDKLLRGLQLRDQAEAARLAAEDRLAAEAPDTDNETENLEDGQD